MVPLAESAVQNNYVIGQCDDTFTFETCNEISPIVLKQCQTRTVLLRSATSGHSELEPHLSPASLHTR